jgi:hypothetical protein
MYVFFIYTLKVSQIVVKKDFLNIARFCDDPIEIEWTWMQLQHNWNNRCAFYDTIYLQFVEINLDMV